MSYETTPFAAFDVHVERDIPYGPSERHRLDVFAPQRLACSRGRPVLVFVHGGGFVAGDRRTTPDSPYYDNVMRWAVGAGMVGASMSYRLAPAHPWPAGPQDIAAALDWIVSDIEARGGDRDRVFLLGHSAGASHVASYVSCTANAWMAGPAVAGAMLLSGVYRVTPELIAQSPTYAAYYGDDAGRYDERSSLAGLVSAWPALWVGEAEFDQPQFRAQASLLRDRLRLAGKPFSATTFAGHEHLSTARAIGSDDTTVADSLQAFVNAHR